MTELPYVDPQTRRGPLYLLMCRFAATRIGLWLAERLAWKLDPYVMKLTRGRLRSTGPIPSAVLETRGARTGMPRRTATLYFNDGDRITIVASKRGAPEHPSWYHNLMRDPDVVFGGAPFRAQVIQDEHERERLWRLADQVFPPFARYREWAARTGRTIPIVQLTRRDP